MVRTPAPEAVCEQCGGSGWVVEADGGAGSARLCGCRQDNLGSRLFTAAAIPARYGRCRLESFKTAETDPGRRSQLQEALAQSRRYVEDFFQTDGSFCHSGLIFVGPPGAGKTHLAVAVLAELISRYKVRGRFVEFTTLVHQIQSTFDSDSPESKRQVLDPVIHAEVLVLDELGAQNPTPWVRDTLYLLINARYTQRLPTLFTTNYRLEAPPRRPVLLDRGADREDEPRGAERFGMLSHRLPSMLVSRLCEMAKPILLDAVNDYRREIQMHRHRG